MNVLFFLPTFCSGGAEAFVVNVAEELVHRGHRCSILSIDGGESVYDSRLDAIGVPREELVMPQVSNPALRYARAYHMFSLYLKKHRSEFNVIHFNAAQGEELPFVWIAKRSRTPKRILHSHNSATAGSVKLICHYLCKLLFAQVGTHYFACSDKAAKWLLPKKVLISGRYDIIKNGIDTERFRFKRTARRTIRQELGLGLTRCYICVGRLDRQKNHAFLLRVFKLILKEDPEAVLLLVGDGPLREPLQALVKSLGIERSVRWLGVRRDISALLSASDYFLLPSLFEGLPFSLVEAQASGLSCVVSEHVSPQCAITNLVTFAPLEEGEYAKAVERARCCSLEERPGYADTIKKAGYDIVSTVDKVENVYLRSESNES